MGQDELVGDLVFPAGVLEAVDTAGGRDSVWHLRVHVDQDVAAAFSKKAGSLDAAHVVVCVDAGNECVLPLDPHHRDVIGGQLLGGDGGA